MPTTYAIPNGATAFAATTYTGNGAYPTTITNGGNNTLGTTFQPDFVWVKSRSTTYDHILYDSVRGTGTGASLVSNSTSAEGADAIYANLTAYVSNGFTVGSVSAGTNILNQSGQTFVGWQWKAGGTSSSNTNGSITSTVSVNATAGFSVVTYTGNGTTGATIGHGLNAVPYMMITKRRSTTSDWGVYHQVLGNTNYLLLDTTAASTAGSNVWNNTSPTSTVFTVGNASFTNTSTDTFVAYCWAQIPGYSKFGSYTGNSSADGTFVYLGFRPRYLLLKNTTTAGYDWFVLDSSRNTYNVTNNYLYPDLSNAEGSSYTVCDFLSNGIKFRDSRTDWNGSSNTYIYAAFAENPFKYANAR